MTPDTLLATLRDSSQMLPLLVSLLCGAAIGFEREFQGKPAGLRTHTLVCFAAALMTLIGLRMDAWGVTLPPGTQIVSDMARMPHAILTGIGFLGAGVIFREGATVQGLTTAASLWLTAALGIVFGTGLLELGVIGTLAALVVLVLLRLLQRLAPPRPEARVDMAVAIASPYDSARLVADLAAQGLQPGAITLCEDRASGWRHYSLTVRAERGPIDADRLLAALQATGAAEEVAITPLESDPGH